jgi:hypothetical protein
MPTIATMRIPPPKDWAEFQDITTAALRIRWSSPTLTQHGRSGQAQQGVDIYGPDDLGRLTGIQCKCQATLDQGTIDVEIANAESFQPPLINYYFSVAGPRDARVQQRLRLLSEERVRAGKFAVGVFFWDDVVEDLTKSPEEFKKHFPDITLRPDELVNVYAQAFAAYDLGYDGVDIRRAVDLIFGEIGLLVNVNPLQLAHLMRLIEASAQVLMPQERHQELVTTSRKLVESALAARRGTASWAEVDGLADTIEAIVRSLQYALVGAPLAALDLGFAMRQWDRLASPPGAPVGTDLLERMVRDCKALALPEPVIQALEAAVAEYNADPDQSSSMALETRSRLRQALGAKRFDT